MLCFIFFVFLFLFLRVFFSSSNRFLDSSTSCTLSIIYARTRTHIHALTFQWTSEHPLTVVAVAMVMLGNARRSGGHYEWYLALLGNMTGEDITKGAVPVATATRARRPDAVCKSVDWPALVPPPFLLRACLPYRRSLKRAASSKQEKMFDDVGCLRLEMYKPQRSMTFASQLNQQRARTSHPQGPVIVGLRSLPPATSFGHFDCK